MLVAGVWAGGSRVASGASDFLRCWILREETTERWRSGEVDESLLTEVTRRLAEISETQHELVRRQRDPVSRGDTAPHGQGRGIGPGRDPRAEPGAAPGLLRSPRHPHHSPPLRPVPRVAASAEAGPGRWAGQPDGASVFADSGDPHAGDDFITRCGLPDRTRRCAGAGNRSASGHLSITLFEKFARAISS